MVSEAVTPPPTEVLFWRKRPAPLEPPPEALMVELPAMMMWSKVRV